MNKGSQNILNVGLFFASTTGNSATIADLIQEQFKPEVVDVYDVLHTESERIHRYGNLIFGVPSWDRKAIHNDWNDFLPRLSKIDFRGKNVALYGLGDQKAYPDEFVNELGILYDWLIDRNIEVAGFWPNRNYSFNNSKAIRNGKFVGLVLDEDSQPEMTRGRITEWVKILRKEFK